jgi:hypothetical protein
MKNNHETKASNHRGRLAIGVGVLTILFSLGMAAGGVANAQAIAQCDNCALDKPMLLAQAGAPVAPRGTTAVLQAQVGVPPLDRGDKLNICCPPNLAKTKWATMFEIDRLPGGNSTSNYGVKFLPNLAFDQYMATYAQFAGMFVSPLRPNSLGLHAEMQELPLGVGGTSGPTSAMFPPGTTTPVASNLLRAWWSYFPNTPTTANYPPTGGIWNGPHAGNVDWKDTFATNSPVVNHSNFMKPGRWYMVKLTLKFHSKTGVGDPDISWIVKDIPCFTKYVSFFINSTETFKTTGGSAQAQLIVHETQ